MDTPQQETARPTPIRHGDTLEAHNPLPTMQQLLGEEEAQRVAAACRFMALRLISAGDRSSAYAMRQTALLFG